MKERESKGSLFCFLYSMIDSNIDAIIFDFGGVLINIDYGATITAFKNLGIKDFDQMYSQAAQSNLFDELEIGQISPQRFINGILEYLPKGTSPNQVVHAWNAMLLDVPEERIKLLLRLKQEGYKIYLLSNTNEIHIDVAYRHWERTNQISPDDLFDHVYLSHEMGMRKPSTEIFHRVCKEQDLTPSNTLFIDDSIQHIEGAKKCGLKTIHLTQKMKLQDCFS